jgi:2-keto-4-pentenoate hydratase/2-oxohepta-3-ene-1,7-dioic acid hydratase in catechol pathway
MWLVTADELPDVPALKISLSVNGVIRQSAGLSDMVYNVAEIVEYAVRFCTLYPGDLIYTGTASGVGPIRAGDVLIAQTIGIGSMEVHIRSGPG